MELNTAHWHSIDVDEVAKKLDTNMEAGLTEKEVHTRKEIFGHNELTKKSGISPLTRFLMQFNQPLIYALIAAGIATSFMREYVDSCVIFGVVLINAVIGYIQEAKAVDSLAALAKTMKTHSLVLRDGSSKTISSHELVPGDIVLFSAGDKISADIRLFHSKGLKANESSLTGESLPVEKKPLNIHKDVSLADRSNMLYASTLITNGAGKGIVIATGNSTQIGKISQLVDTAEDIETPLTKKLSVFSKVLLYIIIAFCALTFLLAVGIYGHPPIDAFMACVAIAVGAIPEGLPAAITVILSIGVARMARRKAIIRKLPAVETLGSTTIICSDKTGTFTENKMTVQQLFSGEKLYSLSGHGYVPSGKLTDAGTGLDTNLSEDVSIKETLLAGLLCNDSKIKEKDGDLQVEGDPTEGALIVSSEKAGLDAKDCNRDKKRIDTLHFESEKQYMATLHSDNVLNNTIAYVKGSNEAILKRCSYAMDNMGNIHNIDADRINKATEKFASLGLRVIAFAKKELGSQHFLIEHQDIENGMIFLGLQAMMDPPREEAISAVKACHNAGVVVKMITGDHVSTAKAIALRLGIKACLIDSTKEIIAVTGAQMEHWSDEDYKKNVLLTSVFARVTPEEKLKIVKSLQALGHIVAMTGDGVNDAPALKQANIGVAMGKGGTEVAKDAADVVLTDDNFASIEAAIEEGRGIFDNLRKFIVWSIPINMSEGLVLMIAIIFNFALPISPLQILWINMISAVFLGTGLAFEPKEDNIMFKKPNDPKMPIFDPILAFRTVYVSALLIIGILILFKQQILSGAGVPMAQTIAANMLVFGQIFYLFNCRSFEKSAFQIGFLSNNIVLIGVFLMILVQLLFTYSPAMNSVFGTAPLGLLSWTSILLFGISIYFLVEIEKKTRVLLTRRRKTK